MHKLLEFEVLRCSYDDRKLNERAREYARNDKAADRLVAWARAEADRIINERWGEVERLADLLQISAMG